MDQKLPTFAKAGDTLRRLRLKANLTQAELANALGDVHSQFVSNWERGLCLPPEDKIPVLKKVLKIKGEISDQVYESLMDDAGRKIVEKWGI